MTESNLIRTKKGLGTPIEAATIPGRYNSDQNPQLAARSELPKIVRRSMFESI